MVAQSNWYYSPEAREHRMINIYMVYQSQLSQVTRLVYYLSMAAGFHYGYKTKGL